MSTTISSYSPWRLFAWSIRRELWNSRAILIAPFAVGALFIAGALVTAFNANELIAQLQALDPRRRSQFLLAPAAFAGDIIKLISILLAATFCVEAFHGERRDRSILFWKSLPVSDTMTVLAKASVPLLVVPIIASVATVITQVAMLGIASVAFAMNGMDASTPWVETSFLHVLPITIFGVIAQVIWQSPLYAWLMLVAGWARRTPFVWAIGVPFAVSLAEVLAFQTSFIGKPIKARLSDPFSSSYFQEYMSTVTDPSSFDSVIWFFTSPAVWAGVVIAAAFIAASVWLRRRAEPI